MTPRARSALILGVLVALAVIIPAVLAYQLGVSVGRDLRVGQLEDRVERLETDVSLLRE